MAMQQGREVTSLELNLLRGHPVRDQPLSMYAPAECSLMADTSNQSSPPVSHTLAGELAFPSADVSAHASVAGQLPCPGPTASRG
eukprot:6204201-Pleurochrysis_carterae.AAC.3